ncbi:hypothetical protein GWK16_11450 [Roseomonas sp. JC162]|uniref:Uncharacterized protein n=1 Tax=Neoroseomonas marina TaxID=1232220 RepID=A0A848EE99_9PROT|nr:hypothetical protein [Neoroseomonas marina]NMJ41859.1 hypothetical protein [Neoroseomonas marina]
MSRIPMLGLAFVLASSPVLAASVTTAWADLPSNDQEECLSIGSRAIQSVGFRPSISQDRQTIFGWRGEEALTVRCISGKGIAVVFAWVTDRANDSGRLVEAVTSAYRSGGAVGGGNLGAGGGGNLGGGGGNFGGGGGNFGGGGGNFGGGGNLGGGPGGVVKR